MYAFSVNIGFRLLDLMDRGMFNMTSETWLKMKFVITKAVGPLAVIDDTVQLVTGNTSNHDYAIFAQTEVAIIANIP